MSCGNPSCEISRSEKLKRHAIFRALVALLRVEHIITQECSLYETIGTTFSLPVLNRSKNFSALCSNEVFRLGICAVPNRVLNALACEKLAKTFGDLSICSGFYQIEGYWRLDIDEKLCRQGLLLPRRDKNGWIYGLQAYRHPDDQHPFFLRSRGKKI